MKQPIGKLSPFKIAAIYAIAGGLWILFSDLILASIVKNSYLLTRVQTEKGWFFVFITSALLYWLVSRYIKEKSVTEERERIFSELTSDYVYVIRIEPDGHPVVEWISASYERITGYTFEDMRARSNLFEDIHPDDMAAVLEENRRVMAGESTVFDTRIITKKGDVRWLRNYVRPIWDAHHNRIIAIYGAAQDITERKKGEEALHSSEEWFRALFENMLEGYAHCEMIFDDENRPIDFVYLNVNSSFEKLTGLKNVVGRRETEIFPGVKDLHPEMFETFGRVALTGKPEKYEIDFKPLKQVFVISIYSIEKGYCVLTFDNITERKKAEKEVRLFQSLINQSNDSIEILDPETGKFIFVNNKTYADLGYSREELLSMKVFDIDPIVKPSEFPAMIDELRMIGGSIWYGVQKRKDGSTFPVEVNVQFVQLDRSYVIAVARDITERKRAEEELRAKEARFHAIIEASPVPYALNDEQQNITYLNTAFVRTFGYGLKDIPTLADWWPKAYPDAEYRQWVSTTWHARLNKAKKNGTLFEPIELNICCKDGMVRTAITSAVSLGEAFKGVHLVVLYDITDRKKTEIALLESQAKLILAMRMAKMGNWACELSTGRFEADELGMALHGFGPGETITQLEEGSRHIHPDDAPEIQRRFEHAVQTRGTYENEYRIVLPDGSIRWIYSLGRVPNGSSYLIGMVQDITDRKKAEEELAQHAKDLSSLAKASNEISSFTLLENIYDAFCRVMIHDFGLDMAWLEIVKEEVGEKAPIAGETLEEFIFDQIRFVWGFMKKEPTDVVMIELSKETASYLQHPGEIVMFLDHGAYHIINDIPGHDHYPLWRYKALEMGYNSAAGMPLISSEGDFAGVLHLFSRTPQFFTDDRLNIFDSFIKLAMKVIENRRLIEGLEHSVNERTKDLVTANERLKELDHLKSMFIASMSHELRTPLNSIIGFSSILLDEWTGPLNDEQKQNLAIVLRSGKHLLALINDVIDISKVEAGTIDINVKDFDLYDVIKETLSSFEKEITDKELKLEVESIHQIMHTDRRRLIQCLSNLVSNAVKFTEKGTVRVSARKVNSEQLIVNSNKLFTDDYSLTNDGNFIEISVSDTGIGIKDEDIALLFKPFIRLESHLKATVPGTGLGLYLTKKLITEALKGDIMVESEYGRGSRFTIRVPVSVV